MLQTGIVRRIDELGRVVVPKEMRKTLRIREGDPLEIFTDKETLVLRKFSPLKSIEGTAETVCEGLKELTKKDCLVTDNDSVIFVTGSKNQELLGKKISVSLINVLNNRKSQILNKNGDNRIIPIVSNEHNDMENQIIAPIILNGDCFGAVVMFDNDKYSKFSTCELKTVELGAIYLSKQFEV